MFWMLAKKFDLVHQTISPHERVGSGDQVTSGREALCTIQQMTIPIQHLISD